MSVHFYSELLYGVAVQDVLKPIIVEEEIITHNKTTGHVVSEIKKVKHFQFGNKLLGKLEDFESFILESGLEPCGLSFPYHDVWVRSLVGIRILEAEDYAAVNTISDIYQAATRAEKIFKDLGIDKSLIKLYIALADY